jgi:hypothetical protein
MKLNDMNKEKGTETKRHTELSALFEIVRAFDCELDQGFGFAFLGRCVIFDPAVHVKKFDPASDVFFYE